MNGVAYEFTAAPVSGAAGMYTADFDGVRASWVVRDDGSAIGVQFSATHRPKLEQSDLQQLNDDQFRTPGAQQAPAAAGRADRRSCQNGVDELHDQRQPGDADSRHRHLPLDLT